MDLRVLTVDLHHLKEGAHFLNMRFLIDVYYVVQGQNPSTNPLNFINQLRKLNLNCHEEDRDSIVEIELEGSQGEVLLNGFHSIELVCILVYLLCISFVVVLARSTCVVALLRTRLVLFVFVLD